MDQFGDLQLSCSAGYAGSPIHFINDETICFLNSNCVKFINLKDSTKKFLQTPGDGIQTLTVNPNYNVIGFSEDGIEARIFIYDIEDLQQPKITLKGDESLGYTCLCFANNGSILASCSNIPEVKLTIWNWVDGIELCSVELEKPILQLKFNPLDWRQLCGCSKSGFNLWNVEKVNEQHFLQTRHITMPFTDGTFGLEFTNTAPTGSRPTTGHGGLYLTQSSIAGLPIIRRDGFDPNSSQKRCVPICCSWAGSNQVYIGCADNHLLDLDTENESVTMLQYDEDVEKSTNAVFDFSCLQMHGEGLFVGGKDGILRCLEIKEHRQFSVKFETVIGKIISSIIFSPNYQQVVVGSTQGIISTYDLNSSSITTVLDDHNDIVVGIVCLINNKFYVTCKSSGLVQVWSMKDSTCVGRLHLNYQICSIVAPASSSTVFIGTQQGSLVVIDISKHNQPRCVYEMFLHKAPLTKMSIDVTGSILVTSSDDKKLFILNARLSTQLQVLGHTGVSGSVHCLSCAYFDDDDNQAGLWKVLVGICSVDHKPGCNQLIEMRINQDLLSQNSSLYMDDTLLLKDASVLKRTYLLKTFIYDICSTSKNTAFGITHQSGKIAKFQFANYDDTELNLVLEALFTYQGHGLLRGCIAASCHNKWLVTASPDGFIIIRAVGAMNNTVVVQAGNYRSNGITHAYFSNDAQTILTVAADGCISTWNWNFTSLGKSKATVAIDTYRSLVSTTKSARTQEDEYIAGNLPTMSPKPCDEEVPTWLDKAISKSHVKEDEKYSSMKSALKNDINIIRQKVLSLMKTNDEVADIERLNRHEFNMDVEERQKIVAEREKDLKEIRNKIELEMTATQYIQNLIKQECWDDMLVKGRSIKSFSGKVYVSNYPMRKRSESEIEELDLVTRQRKVENIELEIRNTILPVDVGSYRSLVEKLDTEGDDEASEHEKTFGQESASTYGSLGYQYGGTNELLQSQFVLHAKSQKRNQIILLQDCVHNIKMSFNQHFDDVYNFKLQEIRRLNDRNIRIQKILKDLGMDEEDMIDISLDDREEPERLFEVRDEEITVEKYISEDEKARLAEEELLEQERRKAEGADNLRGRALEMMMAGRLETNLEEELKKEIEEPEFMSKPQNEWTEDEQKLSKEYEKKKQLRNEEREKFRKALEAELKKLQTANTEAISSFDEKLSQLFQTKTKTELVVFQEELKIVRLNASIMIDDELSSREEELLNFLEHLKDDKQQSSLAVGNARREVEAFRDSYETLVADDRTLDKMFRKEFTDVDLHTIDVLYRFFKKRPRAQRGLKAASITQRENVTVTGSNPFQIRPSSLRAASAAASNFERSIQELDNEQNMPENMTLEVWKKMVALRRTKVEKEQQLKAKALLLADMNAFLQKQVDCDEDLKQSIEKTFEDIQRVRDERLRFNLNLEVQILLKQGQVEMGFCDFIPSYTDSLMIHRSAVEDLNATIKALGDVKLASMRESKEFRKGIHQLAWELKEMFMKAEDLQSAAHDLQMLRVTKELQVYLSDTDQKQSKQQEIGTLEKTLDTYSKMHSRNIQDRKRVIRKLRHQIREKSDENSKLDVDLEEMALSVAERKNINEANLEHGHESGTSKRMQDITTRRKLVDLAKTQASEIGMLRAEVERLRMRTFPALVQLDPR